jgi:hypothetical protein
MKDKEIKCVAIPLHFHQQSYDVMRIAKEIKEERPGTFILSGGFTASFFHREILSSFSQIDAIIRGDAEVPLIELLKALKDNRSLEAIPNLTWRRDEEIRENPLTYVASGDDLDRSSDINLSLLHDKETYIHSMGMPFVWAKGPQKKKTRNISSCFPIFPSISAEDAWETVPGAEVVQSPAGNQWQKRVFRSPAVVKTMAEAMELGYKMFNIAFRSGRKERGTTLSCSS